MQTSIKELKKLIRECLTESEYNQTMSNKTTVTVDLDGFRKSLEDIKQDFPTLRTPTGLDPMCILDAAEYLESLVNDPQWHQFVDTLRKLYAIAAKLSES
jgi:hypothetical protein